VPKRIEFRDLREEQCKLLEVIWQIQTSHPYLGVTADRVIERAGLTKGEFNRLLHELREVSKSSYVRTVKGKKPVRYRLSTEHLVTQSDTATILLKLIEYPQKYRVDGQIPYVSFVQWVSEALRLPETTVKDRIEKAIRQRYLKRIGRNIDYLEIGDRLFCERGYLELLATRFEQNRPKLGVAD